MDVSHVVIPCLCVPVRAKRTGTKRAEPNHQRLKNQIPQIFRIGFSGFPKRPLCARNQLSPRPERDERGDASSDSTSSSTFLAHPLEASSSKSPAANPPSLAFDWRSSVPTPTLSPRLPFLAISCLSQNKRLPWEGRHILLLPVPHLVHEKWLFLGPCQTATSHRRRISMASR